MVHKTNCRKNKNYLNNNLHICLVESQDATTTTTTTTSTNTISNSKSSPITGLDRPRGFQEVKVPRFHDNGTGWW